MVGAGVVFVAPMATVVEPGGWRGGRERGGREGVGLLVREGTDGLVGAGRCGSVVVVGIYVEGRVPEGAFVCLVAEDAEGKDVVLDPGGWVHRMGAGCGIYYGLESLLVDELVGAFSEVLPVCHTSP